MRNHVRLGIVGCLTALVLVAAPAAHAGDTLCVGILPVGTYDNVVVPENTVCRMGGVIVKGNVTALPGSFLDITFSEIGGNVTGDKADGVNLQFRNTVGGNVHIKEGGPNDVLPGFLEVLICGATVTNGSIQVEKMTSQHGINLSNFYCSAPNFVPNGNIKVEENRFVVGGRAEGLRIGQAQIANGNLHVFKNKGPFPKIVADNNVLKGDIQCYENEIPFIGGPNSGRAPNQPPMMMPPLNGNNQCFGTST